MTEQTLAVLLHAIALVETGGRAHVVGQAGERGAFQMTPAVVASAGGYSERHAAKELRRIEAVMLHANIDPSPYNLALAWNAGVGAVVRGRAPESSYDYAQRVRNTYLALLPDPTAPRIGKTPTRPQLGLQRESAREEGSPQHGTGSGSSFSLASHSASARGPEPVEARGGGTFFVLLP